MVLLLSYHRISLGDELNMRYTHTPRSRLFFFFFFCSFLLRKRRERRDILTNRCFLIGQKRTVQ